MLSRGVLALCAFAAAEARSAIGSSPTRPSRSASSLLNLRGGAEPSDALLQATFACNQLYSSVLAEATAEIGVLRKSVTGGEAISSFGAKADEILADAIDKFEGDMPKGEAEVMSVYASRAEELRSTLLASLEPVFVQQVVLLKDAAMEQFKKGMAGDGDASESLASAEASFVREASASVPGKTGWGFKLERASLVGAMQAILIEQKKAQQAKLQTAGQMQTALSYLQMQQQQMQALQAQYTGACPLKDIHLPTSSCASPRICASPVLADLSVGQIRPWRTHSCKVEHSRARASWRVV